MKQDHGQETTGTNRYGKTLLLVATAVASLWICSNVVTESPHNNRQLKLDNDGRIEFSDPFKPRVSTYDKLGESEYDRDDDEVIHVTKTQNPQPTNSPTISQYKEEAAFEREEDPDELEVVYLDDNVGWDDQAETAAAAEKFANATQEDDDYLEEEVPTSLPTKVPTAKPTISPAPTMTTKPTDSPTTTPTLSPSTAYPSPEPTDRPTGTPSASPTLSCHDIDSYRSPINGLTCRQHQNTNCLSWRFVALNMTQLEDLVNSCPQVCGIECGSFQLFSAPVSFRISRVSGFMNPHDVEAFLEFSMDYLEDFVRSFIEESKARKINNANEANESDDNTNNVAVELPSTSNDDDYFLSNEFLNAGGAIVFEIDTTELTSQTLVEESTMVTGRNERTNNNSTSFRRVSRTLVQDLQRTKQKPGAESIVKTDETLDVIVTFDGFSIGMNPETMSELLVMGIDSVDFTRELQQAGIDFFSDATVSSAMETEVDEVTSPEAEVDEEEETKNSTFSTVISWLVPIVVIGFAIGSIVYHRCYKKGRFISCLKSQQQHMQRTQIGGMSTTPMEADTSNSIADESNEHDRDGYFHFGRRASNDETYDSAGNGKTKENGPGGPSAFTRFIAALNLNLTLSRSKNSMDEEDGNETKREEKNDDEDSTGSSSNGDHHKPREKQGIRVISSPIVSPMSGSSESNEVISINSKGFNTYASVLPPMIVIDNIDVPDPEVSTPMMTAAGTTGKGLIDSSSFRSSATTQMNDLDACASEFRKQLVQKSGHHHETLTGNLYDPFSCSSLDIRPDKGFFFGQQTNDDDDFRKIVDTVSEDWDDPLYPPIPSNITADGNVEVDDSMPPRKRTSSCGDLVKEFNLAASDLSSPKKRAYGTWDGNPSQPTDIDDLDQDLSALSLPAALHKSTISDAPIPKRSSLPPKRPPTPEREHSKKYAFPKTHSAFSLRALMSGTIGSNSSVDSGGHNRKSSGDTVDDLRVMNNNSNISAQSSDDLAIVSSKSNNSANRSMSKGTRLEFEAPREGNWGLVLESSSRTGPRIYAVKDYSPLFGLIRKGDKLLEIDGKNVSQSNLAEVTKILKGKSSSYPYHRSSSTTMPLVVSRRSSPNNSGPPAIGSFAYNTSPTSKDRHPRQQQQHYPNYDHRRNNSHGSAGSNGSRVLEDVDETGQKHNNHFYTERNPSPQHQQQHYHHHPHFHHHHKEQNHSRHSSFDYDSSNEI